MTFVCTHSINHCIQYYCGTEIKCSLQINAFSKRDRTTILMSPLTVEFANNINKKVVDEHLNFLKKLLNHTFYDCAAAGYVHGEVQRQSVVPAFYRRKDYVQP